MERLDDDVIAAGLEGLRWERQGDMLVRVIERGNFGEAMELVNGVAQLAEGANHHPDIHISWNKVTLELSTHSAGGITQNDLDLAAAIDGLSPG
ncbi:MAG TPA: 4a-hydroxytetrahydrobiopterin dehydratase [Acidimicrobiales bacterium]|nr:4a-hydroxytetrahydrobiopterin dehydratase [Acidimicrobiales bacterium]